MAKSSYTEIKSERVYFVKLDTLTFLSQMVIIIFPYFSEILLAVSRFFEFTMVHYLLPDAEFGEDGLEDVVGGDGAGDLA